MTLRGNIIQVVATIRSINLGMTMRFPALKPRHPASAVSAALDRGISFMRRVCPTEQWSKKAVLTTPGVRQVTVTPVPATSEASAAENEFTYAFDA
jgi:hypothetical protein